MCAKDKEQIVVHLLPSFSLPVTLVFSVGSVYKQKKTVLLFGIDLTQTKNEHAKP